MRVTRMIAAAAIVATIAATWGTAPAAQQARPADDLPILGLAGITFRVSSLERARGYYTGVLGFAEAFSHRNAAGQVTSVFFKVNDDQYVEVTPDLEPGQIRRQGRVVVQSSDVRRLRDIYVSRGVNPGPIVTGPDGNPVFRVDGPDAARIDFLEYVPGSQQTLARGRFLSPDRVSTHLWHVGIYTSDPASRTTFYEQKLGLIGGRDLPGGRNEYIETPRSDRNLETKHPPLDPENPATRTLYEREVMGAVQHMALEVADMRTARDLVQRRGGLSDLQVRAHVGNNRHWLMHLFDPDGSRTEVMEAAVQDSLPPMTVMAPGAAVAPPIRPHTPGVLPWP
jgi:catechol 2,3-dioxygenase-like lactoylglutathione lyase family enzyme